MGSWPGVTTRSVVMVPRQTGSGGLRRLATELRHPLEQILDPFEGYHPFAARFYTEGDQRPRGVLHDAEKKSHSGESSTRPLAAIITTGQGRHSGRNHRHERERPLLVHRHLPHCGCHWRGNGRERHAARPVPGGSPRSLIGGPAAGAYCSRAEHLPRHVERKPVVTRHTAHGPRAC